MKLIVKHRSFERVRIHIEGKPFSEKDANSLYIFTSMLDGVDKVVVYDRTNDLVIFYKDSLEDIIKALSRFDFADVEYSKDEIEQYGRNADHEFVDRLTWHFTRRLIYKYVLPVPIGRTLLLINSFRYIKKGISCLRDGKIEVPVLDATAISISVLRRDFRTAANIMFLLGLGEILEDWTRKKSIDDLARAMSLNVGTVWKKDGDQEISVKYDEIKTGDIVVVNLGSQIPFDGVVVEGEAMVNQSSMTGESVPVRKTIESSVYAGTVIEEGSITILVKEASGSTKYEKIVKMIEESEKLKSDVEDKYSHLADKLVPYTFLGSALVYILTRDVIKTLGILMVDFSCALKLAMPISVLSAIAEAADRHSTVKGGKYMEALSEANVIVFDKTGTLTKAEPTVRDVIPFGEKSSDECLKIAACLEEHFPHSMALAVVSHAKNKNLEHKEMHSKVEYIVAHGIASSINSKRVVIGSHHFIFEDEKCIVKEDKKELFDSLPVDCSHLYMAIDGVLEAVVLVEDPLREEAKSAIEALRDEGFTKIVMMTGDSDRTARAIAHTVGVDTYYSEVLPEEKASFVEREKKLGNKVCMVGDGINDSPALSAADVGIAISDGAAIAREIADITIAADNLHEIVVLRKLAKKMMKRIDSNYKRIIGINGSLIALNILGLIQPTTASLIHNGSTLAISAGSMKKYLK